MKVPTDGVKPFEFRAWPLDYFVSSGALNELADKVRPFAGLADGFSLEFLLSAQEHSTIPITITPGNAAILCAFVNRHGSRAIEEPYEGQPMDVFVQEVVVPLGAQLDREDAEAERKFVEAHPEPDVILNRSLARSDSSPPRVEGTVETEEAT